MCQIANGFSTCIRWARHDGLTPVSSEGLENGGATLQTGGRFYQQFRSLSDAVFRWSHSLRNRMVAGQEFFLPDSGDKMLNFIGLPVASAGKVLMGLNLVAESSAQRTYSCLSSLGSPGPRVYPLLVGHRRATHRQRGFRSPFDRS